MPNRNNKSIVLIVVLWLTSIGVFLFGVLASAQTRTNPGRLDSSGTARVTLNGTVEQVLHHACSQSPFASRKENREIPYCATTDVVLATKTGFVNVRLGPTKFIRHNHFFFVDGDRLHVIGFLAPGHGRATVVSQEVVKSKRALTFRNPDGRPVWGKNAQSEIDSAMGVLGMDKQAQRNSIPALNRPPTKPVAMDRKVRN